MSEDYAKGFREGFAAGLEEGKKIVEDQWRQEKIKEIEKSLPKPQPRLDDYLFGVRESCPKCGIKTNGVMGYVCSSPNCPTFPNITCGGVVKGAVGSDISYSHGVGTNGPVGKFPSYEEEKERLARYNQVWINGQWAELGS